MTWSSSGNRRDNGDGSGLMVGVLVGGSIVDVGRLSRHVLQACENSLFDECFEGWRCCRTINNQRVEELG
jgi:hypothetical protein